MIFEDIEEHDEPFKKRIAELECKLAKAETKASIVEKLDDRLNYLKTRCHENALAYFENCNYGALHIVTADELHKEIELPDEPMDVAKMLIDATIRYNYSDIGKMLYKSEYGEDSKYSIDELEEIAQHLLIYVAHNREYDE